MSAFVSLGILVSLFSVGLTITVGSETLYEAAVMLATFLLFGHWIEIRARRGSSDAVRKLLELFASFDAITAPDDLKEAAVSSIAALAQLAGMRTVLGRDSLRPEAIASRRSRSASSWAAGGGTAHDLESYRRGLAWAADPAFAPPLLFAPTTLTSSGWWMVDGIHRAAGLLTRRTAVGLTMIDLRLFVLPRSL